MTLADAELARSVQILETLWWECEREGARGWVELWGAETPVTRSTGADEALQSEPALMPR